MGGFRDAARLFERFAREVEAQNAQSVDGLRKKIDRTAIRMSFGTVSTAQMAKPLSRGGLNHPYGHGSSNWQGPRGPIPNKGNASIINYQTGELAISWISAATKSGFNLSNPSEHAQFVLGEQGPTSHMIDRPLMAFLQQVLSDSCRQSAIAALKRAHK